jgi:hypothetical protein
LPQAAIRRCNFVANLLAAGSFGTFAPRTALVYQAAELVVPDTEVKRVLVMFRFHLDVGFIDTQANVVLRFLRNSCSALAKVCSGVAMAGPR